MKPTVLLAIPIPTDQRDHLARFSTPLRALTPAEILDKLREAEGVISAPTFPLGSEELERCSRLRVISCVGCGHDHVDLEAASARGILVTNTPVTGKAVAELTFAMILALARRIPESLHHVRVGGAAKRTVRLGTGLAGKTLGIVGLGASGTHVARIARAFDLKVVYHAPRRKHRLELEGVATYLALDELLGASDIVSLHCPLSAQTAGLIGPAALARMKRGAFLVNTARAGLVDEDALAFALRTGGIGGAALDVVRDEPIRPDHPLLGFDNVLVLPHLGSATVETRRAMCQRAVDNLEVALAGGVPSDALNPHAVRERPGASRLPGPSTT